MSTMASTRLDAPAAPPAPLVGPARDRQWPRRLPPAPFSTAPLDVYSDAVRPTRSSRWTCSLVHLGPDKTWQCLRGPIPPRPLRSASKRRMRYFAPVGSLEWHITEPRRAPNVLGLPPDRLSGWVPVSTPVLPAGMPPRRSPGRAGFPPQRKDPAGAPTPASCRASGEFPNQSVRRGLPASGPRRADLRIEGDHTNTSCCHTFGVTPTCPAPRTGRVMGCEYSVSSCSPSGSAHPTRRGPPSVTRVPVTVSVGSAGLFEPDRARAHL